MDCLYDTGCGILLAKEEVFPPSFWIEKTNGKRLVYANQEVSNSNKMAPKVRFTLGTVDYVYDFWVNNLMKHDIILGGINRDTIYYQSNRRYAMVRTILRVSTCGVW